MLGGITEGRTTTTIMSTRRETLTDRREAMGRAGVVTMSNGMPRMTVVKDKMWRMDCS